MSDTELTSPSLFDKVEEVAATALTAPKTNGQLARNFVRWCCSFDGKFRNSPDEKNLRDWAGRESLSYKPAQESQILQSARELYLKRISSSMSKSSATDFTPEVLSAK